MKDRTGRCKAGQFKCKARQDICNPAMVIQIQYTTESADRSLRFNPYSAEYSHADQSIACKTAINIDLSELFSLNRIYVKYKKCYFVAYRLLLSHIK